MLEVLCPKYRLLHKPSAAPNLTVQIAALSIHQDLISFRDLGTAIKMAAMTAQHTVYRIPCAVIPLHLVGRHLAIWRNIDPYADIVLERCHIILLDRRCIQFPAAILHPIMPVPPINPDVSIIPSLAKSSNNQQ